ncbi:hypothetical protein [Saccharospirillum salsuginis]|uniref:Uncharacterized protein n=1 Tax=Saccharospirillum salsuginis TaxID=418750 RepID=A0A918KVF9_9GAMM|nr:hypothetical protein [Saccharospirillum salsuginis]GGX75430.1 hypothetical protein GCM10007392_48230 [Saccharospirillum salsuginis]
MNILSDTLSTQLDALRQGRTELERPDLEKPVREQTETGQRLGLDIEETRADSPAAEVRDRANDLLLADVWGDSQARSLEPAGPLPAYDESDPAGWASRLAHFVLA